MENTFFIPLSGYHLCFDLPSVISNCFPLCNIHFFSQIKCLFYKKYTDDPNSKEQHIQFADRIWHINFHLPKSTDETYTHCQNPVMIPARILIKDNIFPVPSQLRRRISFSEKFIGNSSLVSAPILPKSARQVHHGRVSGPQPNATFEKNLAKTVEIR